MFTIFTFVSLSLTVLKQWHQVTKRISFSWMSCAVCSLVDPKAPCPAKGPSAFPRAAEPFQSASKALFVAPRYSDFFLCFIHIFLRRLGVPHRLPPVSGREASAPGGRARSYSVVFLQLCLWLANKTQGVYRVLLVLLPCWWQPATQNQEVPGWKGAPVPGMGKSGVGRGSVGQGAGVLHCHHSAWSLSVRGTLTQGDKLQVGLL